MTIHPFLVKLNEYTIKESNQKNFLNSLITCEKLLNDKEITENKDTVETIFIKDILHMIENNHFSEIDKINIFTKLKALIQDCSNKLSNLNNKEDIIKVEKKLHNDLAGIQLELDRYVLKNVKFYSTYKIRKLKK